MNRWQENQMHALRSFSVVIALAVTRVVIAAFSLGLGSSTVWAQQPVDAQSALLRTRDRVLADLERMPRYTCVQTITRRYYRPRSDSASCARRIAEHERRTGKPTLLGWDRLRLEVALVNRNSVYSWVGAPSFESDTLEEFAGHGPLSSGDFGGFLHTILDHASIAFESEEHVGQRRVLAYSYDVPVKGSGYRVRSGGVWTPTAYSGALRLDPATNDIMGLTVRTAELPNDHPACQAIIEIEYQRTRIHEQPILIPRETRLLTIDRNAGETEGLTSYARCREYASTSRMIVGPASNGSAAEGSAAVVARPTIEVPPGLYFRARILTPIDSDTSAAGDPIEAVLLSDLRKDDLYLPAGAHLRGRLMLLEHRADQPDWFRLKIKFESIDLNGAAMVLRAMPDDSVSRDIRVFKSFAFGQAQETAVFAFRQKHLHLEKFDWGWTTLRVPDPRWQDEIER
jgi:hypothetical protein